jgi:hypothetical protein
VLDTENNGHATEKYGRINNCRQNYTQKTKYLATQTALKSKIKLMCSVRVSTSYTNSDTRRVRVIMGLVLQLPMQSVPIVINIVSSNLDHGEVYNIM